MPARLAHIERAFSCINLATSLAPAEPAAVPTSDYLVYLIQTPSLLLLESQECVWWSVAAD